MRYELRDSRQVIASGDATAVRPAADPAIAAVVVAIGAALTAASDQLAERVVDAACGVR
jgi:hypothetical protein